MNTGALGAMYKVGAILGVIILLLGPAIGTFVAFSVQSAIIETRLDQMDGTLARIDGLVSEYSDVTRRLYALERQVAGLNGHETRVVLERLIAIETALVYLERRLDVYSLIPRGG